MKGILSILFVLILSLSTWAKELLINSRYSYYTTEKEVTLIIASSEKKISEVVLFVNGNVLKSELKKLGNGPEVAYFPLKHFQEGVNSVRCNIKFSDRSNLVKMLDITRLAPKPNEVKVDYLTGGIVVDDAPFYPFGFYTSSKMGDLPLQEVYNGFNFLAAYQKIDDETLAQRKAYMDRCAELGMKVHYHLNSIIGSGHNKGSFGISAEEQQRRDELLKKEVEMFKDHPALLCWYLNDEPLGQGRSPKEIERAYQMVKSIDPYHPISIVFMMPERANEFENAMDIAMTDPYPVPGPISKVGEAVEHLRKHFQYKKGIWLVPQAFGGGEMWKREPSPRELRAITYTGLVEGAMAMQAFIRKAPNLRPKSKVTWMSYAEAGLEIQSLLPWLSSEEGSIELETGYESIKARAWKYKGSWLVAVVNQQNRPRLIYVDASDITDADRAKVLFEDRSVRISSGIINVFIDALGTRVFLIDKPELEEKLSVHKANLTINPGFEKSTTPGQPEGCYASSPTDPGYEGSTYFVDPRYSVEGLYSLRTSQPKANTGVKLSFYKSLVRKGGSYRFSVWAKSDARHPKVEFKIGARELKAEKIFTATPEWKEYSFFVEVEDDVNGVHTYLQTIGEGTVWYDLYQLLPDPELKILYTSEPAALIQCYTTEPDATIRYSYSSVPGRLSTKYKNDTIIIKKKSEIHAAVFKKGKRLAKMKYNVPIHKAMGKSMTYHTQYAHKYRGKGKYTLVNGEKGTTVFSDGNWQGFEGTSVDIEMDMGAQMKISSAVASMLVSVNDGIHPPVSVEVLVSNNGKDWRTWAKEEYKKGSEQKPAFLLPMELKAKSTNARFVRFKIESQITVPEGFLFSGTKAWLFIDELEVR
ncbi:hypothetical protein EMN47_06195 [Prolixibacteraceae bacterium JC049]|nr:hypothetical protein [Prolixibacteraceae bacterium JC049]